MAVRSIPALLAERAAAEPGRTLIIEVGGRSMTYAEFYEEALRWAAGLRALGVREGETVVTMTPPCVDSFLAWIGLAWLRAIDTACNTDYQGRMLAYLLNNSGAKVAIVAERWLDRLADVAGDVRALETVVVPDASGPLPTLPWRTVTTAQLLGDATPLAGAAPPEVWDISMMIYTSGTTGPSKGVLAPWGQLYDLALGVIPEDSIDADDVFYSPFPMYHGSGRIGLCLMVVAGGHVVVRERFSGESYLSDLRRYGVTTTALVSAMSLFLWNQPAREDDADNPLRRAVMLPVIPQWAEFQKRFDVKLRTTYAMTEISVAFGTGWQIEDPRSCGRVRPGIEVRLVDEHDYEVPDGEVGELILRADEPWVFSCGYFGMPEATAAAWRNGWFHTGDAFRRDAHGNYFFVDRFKDTIRRRGENVSSFEVELCVNDHPEVAESAAVAVPSEWSEDEIKVVVVRTDGSTLREEDLVSFLVSRMPKHMVPRYVEFADSLPKTEATSRVRKVELRNAGVTEHTWDRERSGVKA